jgi:hypothetical protein
MVTKYRNAQSYNIIENGILALAVLSERGKGDSPFGFTYFFFNSHLECKVLLACRQGSSSAPLPKSTTLSVDDDDDGKGSFRFNQRLSKAPALPASYIDRLV